MPLSALQKPDVAKKKLPRQKVDQPNAVKLSEQDMKTLKTYNKKHFQGLLKSGTLLRLLVRMGLTHPPDINLLETQED